MLSEVNMEKIKEFIAVLDQMIDGKYILADVKINKLVKIINESEDLYKFMTECLINFDFEKEYTECMEKNKLNTEGFSLPKEPIKVVALVYCLLNAFNSKYLDLYDFMRENFTSLHYHTEYLEFGRKIILPFKNIVESYFGLNEDGKSLVDIEKEFLAHHEEIERKAQEEIEKNKEVKEEVKIDERFLTIEKLLRRMLNAINQDRKVKKDLRENLAYILNRSIYALNYQDIELITPLITIFDIMAKKVKCISFDFNDLKLEILKFYDDREDVYNEDELVSREELEDYMNDAKDLLDED